MTPKREAFLKDVFASHINPNTMTKQELKQEKLIAKLKLTSTQLIILNEILELERELTLMEEQPN